MFGMSYAIDAVFLDEKQKVTALVENIKPGQISAIYRNAVSCLELPPGTISATGTDMGDRITWHEVA